VLGQQWEQLVVEFSHKAIEACKELAKDVGDFEVLAHSKREGVEKIHWSDIDVDAPYVLKCFPTSALSTTPSGRLSDVQDLVTLGAIDAMTARRLLDFPDLEQDSNLVFSGQELVKKLVDKIIDTGEGVEIEPTLDLAFALQYGVQSLSRLQLLDDVDNDKIIALREWLLDVQAIAQPAPVEEAPVAV